MPSINRDLWNFPGAFTAWTTKAKPMLEIIKDYQGQPYSSVQVEILKDMKNAGLTTANPQGVQGRKFLNSLAKVLLIDTHPKINVTIFGQKLIGAHGENEIQVAMSDACASIHFWNDLEQDMSRDLNINPFQTVLRILLQLDHLTLQEIEKVVIRIKNKDSIEGAIKDIRDYRNSGSPRYNASQDERNRATWMAGLFVSTGLVVRKTGPTRLELDNNKIDVITNLIEKYFPNLEEILEKDVSDDLDSIIESQSEMDNDSIDSFLEKKFGPPNPPRRQLRKVNSFVRNTLVAEALKKYYNYKCQICGTQLKIKGWKAGMHRFEEWHFLYAETAHVQDHGSHPERDYFGNMLCLCPNCHKNMDNGVFEILGESGQIFCKDVLESSKKVIYMKGKHALDLN